MSLQAELDTFLASFKERVPAEIASLIAQAIDEQIVSNQASRARQPGDVAPDATLLNAHGAHVRLSDIRAGGPAVITFYRGGWCPYCNLELRAYQALLPAFREAGVTLVAVSPQSPDASLSTAEKSALGFEILSDVGCHLADAFGIAFDLAEQLRAVYSRLGHALPDVNAADDWRLPIPATFVLAADGRIALAHVDADYRHRLEPSDALAAAIATRT